MFKENDEVEETAEENKTQECKDQLDICSSWRGQEAALCQYSNIFKLCPKTCKACTVSEVTQETFNTTVIPGTTLTPVITKPVVASAAQDHSCEKVDIKFSKAGLLDVSHIFSFDSNSVELFILISSTKNS